MLQSILMAALGAMQTGGYGMRGTDIPSDAVNDAIMAKKWEIKQVQDWAQDVFGAPTKGALRIRLLRQDYATLQFGRSAIGTPIKIGETNYKTGLGTHANSVIEVDLPEGANAFEAVCGIDNNFSTQGKHGSVVFSVDVDGKERFRSQTLTGGDKGLPVKIADLKGARTLTLKVESTTDGAAFDQADWADARIVLTDGKAVKLDSDGVVSPLRAGELPFSFVYDGSPADLSKWQKQTTVAQKPAFTQYTTTWTDPKTDLKVHALAKAYKRYAAVDWVLHFENAGGKDTPIIENVQAMDAEFNLGGLDLTHTFHRLTGDVCGAGNFVPIDLPLAPGAGAQMVTTGGRSSQISGFPFLELESGKQGVVAAVGWTGQWASSVQRDEQSKDRMKFGMELTHLKLHPGERIRTPRALLMTWNGDREEALIRWRRMLLHHYSPQLDGKPAQVPISLQCFDRYSWGVKEWSTEKGQIQAAEAAAKIGCDVHWLDASWFPGAFPHGVGNWFVKPQEFPNGLKPVSDACHKLGLGFMLWFEPERVGANTQIATEHPEWVFGGNNGGLFRLDLPEARRWMTDLLLKRIKEYGLDVYREDFNMDPLADWRANDAPDRQGMTEIRSIEGLYEMWDEILAKNPGIRIDNCSSGGRRIDLETISRSMALWRSDTGCGPGNEGLAQSQSAYLFQYLPIHSTCSWIPKAYDVRSAATTGIALQFDYLNKDFPWKQAQAAAKEVRENSKYWYGDFYALTPFGTGAGEFVAFQLHRPDLDAGIVIAFRREKAVPMGLILPPRAIKASSRYEVEFIDEDRKSTKSIMTGKELLENGLELRIPKQRASLVVRYRAVK
jgi:alpha-galactosidase